MLARSVTLAALVAAATNPGFSGRPDVATVDVHSGAEVTIGCGGEPLSAASWHTPFGPLESSAIPGRRAPIHVRRDGSLALRNVSVWHQGLYYCVGQRRDGSSAVFPYLLRTDRGRRDGGGEADRREAVSQRLFAGAVAAAALLAFLPGFAAGALSRPKILRCLRAKAERSSPARRPDLADGCPWPPSCPPAKPQRSFRQKAGVDREMGNSAGAADLEAGERVDEARGSEDEEEVREAADGKTQEEKSQGGMDDASNGNDERGPSSSRRRRIIRVYQYDQDGRPYGHLPASEPEPAPNQRAVSLSHLDAIMAAASTGPLEAGPQKDPLSCD
ncbi:uncharacterized protein LOC144083627 [Stigmatopora argus]